MNHSEARNHLDELATGLLAPAVGGAVQAHVDDCDLCAAWLLTYGALHAGPRLSGEHPDSGAIAEYAFEPANVAHPERAALEDHLRDCQECRSDYKVTRQALEEARPDHGRDEFLNGEPAQRDWNWRPALGIAAAAALILVALLNRPVNDESLQTTVANQKLTESQVIEGGDRLFATNVEVGESAQVALRAANGVSLGEGFSVKQGGRLVIGSSDGKQES